MFNSEILKEARNTNNVEIKIHYGYKFERGKEVFTKYIEKYFDLKFKSDNNEGRRLLAKLMQNSLYGRFGLKYRPSITKIVSIEQAKELILKYQVIDNFKFDDDLEFIKYNNEPSDILKETDIEEYNKILNSQDNNKEDFINRSLPISAMITGYASCFMNKFLNLPNNECYYTDTDSLVLIHPLDSKYVGNNIGQFKFLGKIKRGYFIAPKLYCIILDNGNTIIKAKGINNKYLNENDFKEMLYGINKTIPITRFLKN
jgi:hypothetical protein